MKKALLLIMALALSFIGGCSLFHQHELVHHEEITATCTTEGYGAYDTCAGPDCDYITEYDIYPAAGHTLASYEEKPATCLENGHTPYEQCIVCLETFGYKELPATGHELEHYWKKKATKEEPGHSNYSACKNCNYTTDYEEFPYLYTIEELLPPLEERLSIVNLSKLEQAHLKAIHRAVTEFRPSYYFQDTISASQLNKYYSLLLYACPELIQLDESYHYTHDGDDVSLITFDYLMSAEEYRIASDTIAREVLSVVSQTEGMSEFETERFLHDYMVEWCTYNKTTTIHSHSPYGFFLEQKAKCGGYARTFMLLLSAAGIESHCILGTSRDEFKGSVGHVWNLVKIGDSYYYADVTWDDSGNPASSYCYFNLDLATLLKNNHTIHDYYDRTRLECDSMKLYVPYQDGTYISEDQDSYTRLSEMIDELIKNNGKSLHIKVATQEQFRSVKNNIDYLMVKYKKEHKKNFRYDWFDSSLNFYFGINISDMK